MTEIYPNLRQVLESGREFAPGSHSETVEPRPSSISHLVEIRILGPLDVRRPDGSTVHPSEWRTGKTADLLQLLALHGDRPTSPQSVVKILWPRSDHQHGLASLRTALSRIRRVIGHEHLERTIAGLRLTNAWVDAVRFRELVDQASTWSEIGDESRMLATAREAEALYRSDLQAYDVHAAWAQAAGQSLVDMRQSLLCDAASAAISLGLRREAIEFANTVLSLNPYSERAIRLLMRSHAERGELSLALNEYERCRARFAERLGTEPSPETRELHLSLLRRS